MNPTRLFHEFGQRLWLDNITRTMLDDGTLERYISVYTLSGLTSNPTIFDEAIGSGDSYDLGIREKTRRGLSGEALFIELALEDLRRAADLFQSIHQTSGGIDGWVSMEVSPLLADDSARTVEAAAAIHRDAKRPNLFVKIPGTPAGVSAIEQSIFAGIPINVTLLFSREQYLASAEAYMRGIERRIAARLDPQVASVASLFVSRWDKAVVDAVPAGLHNRLGIAIAQRTYAAYRELLASPRWQKLEAAGARPQRLLWASTGSKDPDAPATIYAEALAAPDTIDTLPDKTLRALAEHGKPPRAMAIDGGDSEATLGRFAQAGVDIDALAEKLQRDGAASFVKSWQQLMERIATRSGVALDKA
jgi:transaldolase